MGARTVLSDGEAEATADRLASEVRDERDEIAAILDELDLRRRELLDWRLQLRRHAKLVAAVAILAGGSIGLAIWRRRRRQTPIGRFQRFRNSLARAIAGNDRADLGARTAGAAASQASAAAAGQLAKRIFGLV